MVVVGYPVVVVNAAVVVVATVVVATVVVEVHEGKMSTSTRIAMGPSTGYGSLDSINSKVSVSCSYL